MRIKSIISVLLALISISVLAQDVEEQLGAFRELKTFSGIEVSLIPSQENKIVITGHSKEDVNYKIVGDRLEIRLGIDNLWSKDNTQILVYAKDLKTIDANEGSVVSVEGSLEGELLQFRAQEGAAIYSGVKGTEAVSKAISGGRIELRGNLDEQEVETNTGGQFLGSNLRTLRTEVSANTAGKAVVYASQYCKATAKIGGTIEIYGNPDDVDSKTSLGGKIL